MWVSYIEDFQWGYAVFCRANERRRFRSILRRKRHRLVKSNVIPSFKVSSPLTKTHTELFSLSRARAAQSPKPILSLQPHHRRKCLSLSFRLFLCMSIIESVLFQISFSFSTNHATLNSVILFFLSPSKHQFLHSLYLVYLFIYLLLVYNLVTKTYQSAWMLCFLDKLISLLALVLLGPWMWGLSLYYDGKSITLYSWLFSMLYIWI